MSVPSYMNAAFDRIVSSLLYQALSGDVGEVLPSDIGGSEGKGKNLPYRLAVSKATSTSNPQKG